MSVLMMECRSSEEYQVVFTAESSLEPIAKVLSQGRHKPLGHLSSGLQGQMETLKFPLENQCVSWASFQSVGEELYTGVWVRLCAKRPHLESIYPPELKAFLLQLHRWRPILSSPPLVYTLLPP